MMSGLVSLVFYFLCYMFIVGFMVLALVFFFKELNNMDEVDFELVLFFVFVNFIFVGFLGLFIVGFLVVFMFIFVAIINVVLAYVVNDIYKCYINVDCSEDFMCR